jgi:2,4-diketo-3-deoxy-L-fuconate hydrolase
MRLCRFDTEHLGVWMGEEIADVTEVLNDLPRFRWARGLSDPVVENLDDLRPRVEKILPFAKRVASASVSIEAPVAMPSKIIGAPVNYHSHVDEAQQDHSLHQGRKVFPIDEIGCFLKAGSALCGHNATIELPRWAERVDHEAEVAVIIGKSAKDVMADTAMSYVAGYSLAFDMTVRGKQDRSMRKSCDGFAVLGLALVTAEEVTDSASIAFELTVNGEARQAADTGLLIRSIPELIEMCSAFYTLLPGDVIMTGTPAGVGPVVPGDRFDLASPQLGELSVSIR